MSNDKTTALVRIDDRSTAPALLRPIATPAAFVSAHKEAAALIRDALEEGKDYGRIPGAGNKPALLKPGAERLALAFGCHPVYSVVERECDHDRVVTYVDKGGKERKSLGLYRYVMRCSLVRQDGSEVGDGLATCSTMESKYVSRPRDCENTALKMASKRALVAAVLNAFGLSDRFTQDVEDHADHNDAVLEGPLPDERPAPRPAPSSDERLAKAITWAVKHVAKVRIAGAVPADADDDAKKGAQEAVRTARDEDDKGCRALEGVDKRLSVAVRALADEIEARTLGIDYQRNNDEAEAIAWFTEATAA